ncbi:MAG TPA: PilZ domain-containing protein [Candidatus Saccharimonadales bacterium]|nr:PilZ domain-containing protein [Candidatus Saccharimonadales bacterium]
MPSSNGKPIRASLADISRGGCFVETDHEMPLESQVTVTLRKDGDRMQAMARVVRVSPGKGLALEFTSMERGEFQLLDSWLSRFLMAAWAAANRRKAQRVAMQIKVNVSGYNSEGARFGEETKTITINAFGCLLSLRNSVKKGQRLVLSYAQTKKTAECLVVHQEGKGAESNIGLAFAVPGQSFWPVDFPPADWTPRHPDAK